MFLQYVHMSRCMCFHNVFQCQVLITHKPAMTAMESSNVYEIVMFVCQCHRKIHLQDTVSGGHIILGNSALLDRISQENVQPDRNSSPTLGNSPSLPMMQLFEAVGNKVATACFRIIKTCRLKTQLICRLVGSQLAMSGS